MDFLKNTLEEIVIKKVEQGFKDNPDICQSLQCKKDVAVLILNKIKPRYIISARGMLHQAANTAEQKRISKEIDSVLPSALKQVNEHRRPNFDHNKTSGNLMDSFGKKERFTMTDGFFINFPFFLGEVRDRTTDEIISDVKVSMSANEKILDGYDGNWPNPYETSDKSGGKFAFWPKSIPTKNDPAHPENFDFKLIFESKKYKTKEISFSIELEPEKFTVNFVRTDYSKDMDIVALDPK